MKITDLLSKESIALKQKAASKKDILKQMVDLMDAGGKISDKALYLQAVEAREEEGTTGVGGGIAIPHGRCSGVKAPGLAAMSIDGGVEYEALDGNPVDLLFLIAAPETSGNVHLDILSKLATMLMDEKFVKDLKNAKDADEFLKIIDRAEEEKDESNAKKTNEVLKDVTGDHLILAVTACPTGIAHTYMAAEAIEKAAKARGYQVKVETNAAAADADRAGKPAPAVETAAKQDAKIERKSMDRYVRSEAAPLSDNTVTNNENTITVTVTAKDASGVDVNSYNGKMTVAYDAEALTLVSAQVNADYSSVNDKTAGSVVFAYVDLEGVAASETVATLVFTRNDGTVGEGSLTVTDDQVNDTNPGYAEELVINYEHPNTEIRNAKEATCTEHGYTGDTYCADCGKLLAEGEETPLARHEYEDGSCVHCGAEQPAYILGDVNGDGEVDGLDLLVLRKYLAGTDIAVNEAASDLNGDGEVTGMDLLMLRKLLAE